MKDYFRLTKMGITIFALLSAGAGYVTAYLSHPSLNGFVFFKSGGLLIWLLGGLYFTVSGSFVLNQASEWRLDKLMKRTRTRPIPFGKMTALQAFALGIAKVVVGFFILLALNPLTAVLALLAVLFYNLFYTFFWKKKYIFSAVPGALPGALPVMIGYSAHSSDIFSAQSIYLFFLLFLWQMPHFWSLALHYKEDYRAGGVPVPPLHIGSEKTLYYIGFYLLSYLGLVLVAPLFFKMNIIYVVFLIPFCAKVFWEFIKFSQTLRWKPFFMWLNLSVLLFLYAPSGDMLIYATLGSR